MQSIRIVGILLFSLITTLSKAQSIADKLHWSLHYTVFADMIWSPLVMEYAPTGNTIIQDGQEVAEYREIPVQSFINNVLSGGVEVRYNLTEFNDDQALALSVPISFGIGHVTQPPNISGKNHHVANAPGYGSFQLPVMAKLYFGAGATSESTSYTGFSLGFGIEFNKLGVVQFQQQSDVPAPSGRSNFVIPVGSLSYHVIQGRRPAEFRIKYGRGPLTEYFIDKYGNPILNDRGIVSKGIARAQSISFSFVYPLTD